MIRCWPVLRAVRPGHVRRTLRRHVAGHAATAVVLVCAGSGLGLAVPPWLAAQPDARPAAPRSATPAAYVPAGVAERPGDRVISVLLVPEPSSALLLAGAAGVLALRRRR